jgi:DNA processing protein
MRACVDCLRMAQLLAELTPGLDRPAGGRPSLVLSLEAEELAAAVNGPRARRARTLDRSEDDLLSGADRDERELGVEAVCRHHPDYPSRLLDLSDPPAVLHVLGGVGRLHRVLGPGAGGPAVSIVGARRPPEDARRIARRFAQAVASSGITVVSGMAFGIDEAAHEGALAAGSPGPRATGEEDGDVQADRPRPGGTVAVLAAGVERPTPASLRGLYARIAEDGVVVGELPPGASPRRWSFPARNRLIAALGDGLVVVAAGRGSGSLHSVTHARNLQRPVGVVPGSILDPRYAGGNDVLRGADLVCDEEDGDPSLTRAIVDADDVRRMLHDDRLRLAWSTPDGGWAVRQPDGPASAPDDRRDAGDDRPGTPEDGPPAAPLLVDPEDGPDSSVSPVPTGRAAERRRRLESERGRVAAARREREAARRAAGRVDAVERGAVIATDPLEGLDGEARAIGERLLAGPRTIESLIGESGPAAVLAGLGALEAAGRLRRSLGGELELTAGDGPGASPP